MDALVLQPITHGAGFTLKDYSTKPAFTLSKAEAKRILVSTVAQMAAVQERMYASSSRALIIVIQAMDAAGKDGTIERLLTGINPQGVRVTSFKAPSPVELKHDFLWRIHPAIPPKGIIAVFNRSHYEEVLVVKVHPQYLLPQFLPGIHTLKDVPENFWKQRYEAIRNFEERLTDTGTSLVKFFLHVSKAEQRQRLEARMKDQSKQWKFNLRDVQERAYWPAYMNAYQEAIAHTATPTAPWYVVPADHKPTMRALINSTVADVMRKMSVDWPKAGEADLAAIEEGQLLFQREDTAQTANGN